MRKPGTMVACRKTATQSFGRSKIGTLDAFKGMKPQRETELSQNCGLTAEDGKDTEESFVQAFRDYREPCASGLITMKFVTASEAINGKRKPTGTGPNRY